MIYYRFVQYPIAMLIIILSLMNIKKIKKTDIILVFWLIILGMLSFIAGKVNGLPSNIRPILVPIIFIIVFNSNSYKYLKPLFIFCLLITVIEYIAFFTGLDLWRDLRRGEYVIGFNLLRPYGMFLDVHSNSLFLSVSLFLFGYPIVGAIAALFFMTLQTPIAYLALFLKKKNILIFLIFSSIVIIILYKTQHLNPDLSFSMLSSYLAFFDYDYDYCYIIGCASNLIVIQGEQNLGIITDNGFVRTSFFFGIPWLILYFILLVKNSKHKVLPIVYFLTILHYPVAFGIINTAIIGISLNYFNNITFFKNKEKSISYYNNKLVRYIEN